MIFFYFNYMSLIESLINQECLLCPTGFAANVAVMTAITTQLPQSDDSSKDDVTIFSDALNHASIIDGIRLSRRQCKTDFKVYKHCNVEHLSQLL